MGDFSTFRSVGAAGDPYPVWVSETRGRNGVYAIKDRGTLVYIGESHSDRLYETMTRHFQHWRGTGADSHPSYTRGECTASVLITSAASAPTIQAHEIATRAPRDNVYETEADDAIPF